LAAAVAAAPTPRFPRSGCVFTSIIRRHNPKLAK
jgi:hypothetical protein